MSIPKSAQKVFKGIIFDVYHWQQKMYDGSFKTFEKLKRQDTVVIVATVGDRIVLLKQQQPDRKEWYYDLPSGRMDKAGETPKKAALRELREETGLKPKRIKLWKTYSPSGKVIQKVYFFVASDCTQVSAQQLDAGEKISVLYLEYEDFLKVSDSPHCYFGPFLAEVLMARIHPERKRQLKAAIFGSV